MAKKISLQIHTIEGDTVSLEASPTESLEAVFHQAVQALGIDPTLASNYYLVFNGERLNLHQSVQEAALTDGSDLILTSQPQVG
jgi:hypothetical protein